MTLFADQTLAGIVTNDYRAATILEKYQLDYCCKGKRTLSDACNERGLITDLIVKELAEIPPGQPLPRIYFSGMNAQELISYILVHHHFYVNQQMPLLNHQLQKVVIKHGDRFPYMAEVWRAFSDVTTEMEQHMRKEELVLFPAIVEAEAAQRSNNEPVHANQIIRNAIGVMESEHDHAGELLARINRLTNSYDAPNGACTTFKLVLAGLDGFEKDLHQHVHLENNLLFPLAQKLIA